MWLSVFIVFVVSLAGGLRSSSCVGSCSCVSSILCVSDSSSDVVTLLFLGVVFASALAARFFGGRFCFLIWSVLVRAMCSVCFGLCIVGSSYCY